MEVPQTFEELVEFLKEVKAQLISINETLANPPPDVTPEEYLELGENLVELKRAILTLKEKVEAADARRRRQDGS